LNEILKQSKIQKIDLTSKEIIFLKKVNEITDKGLEYLKESLMYSEYLKVIILFKNCISDEGCFVLNEILKKSKIEIIDLQGNNIIKRSK
jgi:Ran GTPase-activating protein (RanGAP) involved in mRNA processing and transport